MVCMVYISSTELNWCFVLLIPVDSNKLAFGVLWHYTVYVTILEETTKLTDCKITGVCQQRGVIRMQQYVYYFVNNVC